jgi:hypothetical protein
LITYTHRRKAKKTTPTRALIELHNSKEIKFWQQPRQFG